MKILYIHQYFKTPEEGGGIRSWYLSQALIDQGHEVDLITSHNSNEYLLKNINGVKVHYLPVPYSNNFGVVARVKAFFNFVKHATEYSNKLNPDVCYVSSTPLTTGLIGLRLKKDRGIKYIFEVRDLWPDAIFQMGYFKFFPFREILTNLERRIYEGAEKIVALSPAMAEKVKERAPEKEVIIIPNLSDVSFFSGAFKKEPTQKFVTCYFGAVGKVNGLDNFLDVAKNAEKNKPGEYEFIIAGDGAEKARLQQRCNQENIGNVKFYNWLSKEDLYELLKKVDAAFISFSDKKILETSSPNKFFDSIAAGKLVIVNYKGWVKELIEKNECGFYVDPSRPAEFIEKADIYKKDPDLLKRSGEGALRLAKEKFSREILSKKFMSVFK